MNKINVNVDFQNKAIDKLKKRIKFALDSDGDIREFNFKSCVASGKTVMCARLMQELIGDDDYKDFSFLWISTSQGNLCYQSKDTISGIVSFECNTFEQALALGEIPPKPVLSYLGSKLIKKIISLEGRQSLLLSTN